METNLKELCNAVEHIARLAGDFIRREREAFTLERVEQKHAHDYVYQYVSTVVFILFSHFLFKITYYNSKS